MKKFGKLCKEHMIQEISEYFKGYPDFFVTSFRDIETGEMEKLRKSLKKGASVYLVAKNRMLKQAIKESGINIDVKKIGSLTDGSCGVFFTNTDPAMASRVLMDFAKNHETLKVKAGFINGSMVSSEEIKFMSTLPSREVLLSKTFAAMKSPITGFAGVLRNLLVNLVGVVDAISKKKSGNT